MTGQGGPHRRPWIAGPWLVRLTDDRALADVRARYVAVMTVACAALGLIAHLIDPTAFHERTTGSWGVILLPLAVACVISLRLRERLGERGYLLSLMLVDVAATAFIALVQPAGATTSMELILILPSLSAAVFCAGRAVVAVHTVTVLVAVWLLVGLRAGSTGTAPATMLGEGFILVLTTGLMRWLRDAARESLHRAEVGEMTDPLTGLANRRGLERFVHTCWAGHARLDHRLAFLVVDVDHFKQVNDKFGHRAGDELLRRISELLSEHVRADDLVVRLGGEEFLLLARVPAGGAEQLAERLRRAVEQRLSPVTASIGVLEVRPLPDDAVVDRVWDAVDSADHALYLAKQAGRNRVVVSAGTGSAPRPRPPGAPPR
ncbi:MAG TPA: GGDEF domain-containing protein [Kineosporiaceae bacterium]|nr:GGDEF domain-containing protein [Kineosporiaceae bacterium]